VCSSSDSSCGASSSAAEWTLLNGCSNSDSSSTTSCGASSSAAEWTLLSHQQFSRTAAAAAVDRLDGGPVCSSLGVSETGSVASLTPRHTHIESGETLPPHGGGSGGGRQSVGGETFQDCLSHQLPTVSSTPTSFILILN